MLKVGADPTTKLKDNCTVLIEASGGEHFDVIDLLLRDNELKRKLPMPASLINSHSHQYLGKFSNLDIDLNQIQSVDNQYIKSIEKGSFGGVGLETDAKNKFLSIPMAMRLQNTILCFSGYPYFGEHDDIWWFIIDSGLYTTVTEGWSEFCWSLVVDGLEMSSWTGLSAMFSIHE